MKKTLLVISSAIALVACGPNTSGPITSHGEIGYTPPPVSNGPVKTRAEVLKELADFKAACKADAKLMGCGVGEAAGTNVPVVGTAKTRAEVSAELAAFLAACKASPKGDNCPGTNSGQ
jgi:hypothetical protein